MKAAKTLLVPLCIVLVATPAQARVTAGAMVRGAGSDVRFEDVSTSARVDGASRTWGSTWTDWDLDGDPDLFLNRHHRVPQMLENNGGVYRSVNEELFEAGFDRHGCAWGEASGDGLPDLYCVQGADKGTGTGPNQLLVQTVNGFADETELYGVKDVLGRGRTTHWIDVDRDRDLDIFVGNAVRKSGPNVMYRNVGGSFRRVDIGLPEHISTSSSAWLDWDNDGDPDVLITQHRKRNAKAFENVRGDFRRVQFRGLTRRPWVSVSPGDFDGDGRVDVTAVGKHKVTIFKNTGDGFRSTYKRRLRQGRMATWLDVDNDADLDAFIVQGARGTHESEEINHPDFVLLQRAGGFDRIRHSSFRGPTFGNGDAVVAADHDRDGLVDLFITNGLFHWTGPNELLENRTVAGHWAAVVLRGPPTNPLGTGTRIRVVTEKRSYWRSVGDGVAYRTQADPSYVHLGLGDALTAQVKVDWPGRHADCFEVAGGEIRTVPRGSSPC